MILKIVILFLVFMGVLGMFGKLRRPKLLSRRSKCPDCGRHRIGKGPCPCKKVRG
ncbi:hypothetical protein [Roseivivax jejudonensis]|uniref:hypothetical protein n=1 Tax=Roseivivax jejudonensis TaxID=1529041 RepID=UPI00135640E9|nr:hypothetical protein [Roseivivax jejudonensis]